MASLGRRFSRWLFRPLTRKIERIVDRRLAGLHQIQAVEMQAAERAALLHYERELLRVEALRRILTEDESSGRSPGK